MDCISGVSPFSIRINGNFLLLDHPSLIDFVIAVCWVTPPPRVRINVNDSFLSSWLSNHQILVVHFCVCVAAWIKGSSPGLVVPFKWAPLADSDPLIFEPITGSFMHLVSHVSNIGLVRHSTLRYQRHRKSASKIVTNLKRQRFPILLAALSLVRD